MTNQIPQPTTPQMLTATTNWGTMTPGNHEKTSLSAKRFIITIRIASNTNFASIEFGTQQLMETFSSQTLLIQGFNISFYPDKRKTKPQKRLMNISFPNIPPETPERILTEFLETYADIEDSPLYATKTHNGVEYCTGTRVYQVTRLYQHIPRRLPNILGRTRKKEKRKKKPKTKHLQQKTLTILH